MFAESGYQSILFVHKADEVRDGRDVYGEQELKMLRK